MSLCSLVGLSGLGIYFGSLIVRGQDLGFFFLCLVGLHRFQGITSGL